MKVKWLSRVRLLVTPWTDLPGSSVHGMFQERVLEWGAIVFSKIHLTSFILQVREKFQVTVEVKVKIEGCTWFHQVFRFGIVIDFQGEGNGTPLQYSCLENPMDGGAWQAAVQGVPRTWTRLSDWTELN